MPNPGRRSAASMAVAPVKIDGRVLPPKELTKPQRDLWTKIVATEAVDLFKSAAAQHLLMQLVRHVDTAAMLAGSIDVFDVEWLKDDAGLDRLERLLKLRDREVKATVSISTKLRLTPQSRYTAKAAATAGNRVGAAKKPWDTEEPA